MNVRASLYLALMYAIRYTPLPMGWKLRAVRLATPRVPVVGAALVPEAGGTGRYLMLRARYSGRWILPGGSLRPGENPRAGTERELREELGCVPAVERLVGMYSRARTGELLIVFRCAPLDNPPRLSPEHDAWRYVATPNLAPHLRGIVADATREDREPIIKAIV